LSDTLKSVKKGIATEALLQSQFMAAARPPLIAFEKTLDISETLLAVAEHTNRNLKTDTLMVADLLCCALRSHRLNVDVNLAGTNNPDFIDQSAKRLAAGRETLSALERLRDTF
jgi:formiminotetrahydrofolate cyclodeaminase